MPRIKKEKPSYIKFTGVDGQDKFLSRISKTLYYTKLPGTDSISLPMSELASEIFTEVKNGQTLERLDVEEATKISRNACVSPCSFVLSLLYLERLKDCNPEYLQRVAPSELFLVSLMVASKFLHDDGVEDEVFNKEWAPVGDLCTERLNFLEKEFLKAIDWSVYVNHQDFWKRLQRLEKDIAYKEAGKRGFFSYTELNTLLDPAHLALIANTVLSVASMYIAIYTAGLITLLGSTVLTTHLSGTLISSIRTQESSLKNFQYSSSHAYDSSEADLEEQNEIILLNSITKRTEICNKSYVGKQVLQNNLNNTVKVHGLKWIIDSVTISNYLNKKLVNYSIDFENKLNENSIMYVTKDFINESNSLSQYFNNKAHSVLGKQILNKSLLISSFDWKYYIGYFSKIILSYGK